jgi:predicted amino acid-binding ACT domain protein
MPKEAELLIKPGDLVGSLAYGENRRQISLRLCQVFRDVGLDIIDVESHVRRGWFSMLVLARNPGDLDIRLARLKREISAVARDFRFASHCFQLPSQAGEFMLSSNVVIVLNAENRPGLLAYLLEVLDRHQIDMVNVDVELDPKTSMFAVQLDVYIPHAQMYPLLKQVRADLAALRDRLSLASFSCMVHARETFQYLQEIDFEQDAGA